MLLKNITQKTILSKDLKKATSFPDQLLGLLRPGNPRSLLFFTRFGIHTFGIKESIDVLVLDSKYRVVKIKTKLAPNKVFFWNPKYNIIIELPVGFISKSKTRLGDKLLLMNTA